MNQGAYKLLRKRRVSGVVLLVVFSLIALYAPREVEAPINTDVLSYETYSTERAVDVLDRLEIKGRAPKTGYSRSEFGDGWASLDGCDLRNIMLNRSLDDVELFDDDCTVASGVLNDPYTGQTIQFLRGTTTSNDVQIDHVVALSDAWQKGAQQLDFSDRVVLANDPLNLLAVDGEANQQKGDSDAASWLPSNISFRCRYVARQIAVKDKYSLWVTEAEYATMRRILNGCGEQRIPVEL